MLENGAALRPRRSRDDLIPDRAEHGLEHEQVVAIVVDHEHDRASAVITHVFLLILMTGGSYSIERGIFALVSPLARRPRDGDPPAHSAFRMSVEQSTKEKSP